MTQIAWESGNLTISDPEATEAECWATISIYPTYHKIIGNLTESVLSMIKQYVRIHLLKNSTNSWKVGKHKLTCSQGYLIKGHQLPSYYIIGSPYLDPCVVKGKNLPHYV
jgi:hypothetical protein